MVWDKWEHRVGFSRITDSLKKQGYCEDDIIDGEDAVVLYAE